MATSLLTLHIWLFAASVHAQETQLVGTNTFPSSIANLGGDQVPTGPEVTYQSYASTMSVNATTTNIASEIAFANGSASSTTSSRSSASATVSILQGTYGATASSKSGIGTKNQTATRTSSSARPTNTQPCNNYAEFCGRKYSNITYVAAHNSPFVAPNNAASNQNLGVIDQLNDGIRMLQGQTHWNSTTNVISYCHSSCDLLDAGTAESYFRTVSQWVQRHPFDIVTILIGNSDFIDVGNYTAPLTRSGLARYAYVPSQIPMSLSAWPTLGEMILRQKRVVIFMDYNANQVGKHFCTPSSYNLRVPFQLLCMFQTVKHVAGFPPALLCDLPRCVLWGC